MKPGKCEQAPRDPSQWDGLDTYPVAQVEALVQRIDELEAENKGLAARVAELEARCKRLEESARAVYLDSIASDHPWSTNETRNMHALRDVLEAKP